MTSPETISVHTENTSGFMTGCFGVKHNFPFKCDFG